MSVTTTLIGVQDQAPHWTPLKGQAPSLEASNRPGWKWLSMINTLSYLGMELATVVKKKIENTLPYKVQLL